MNPVETVKNSVDMKTMFSVVAGMAVFGAITYAAVRSGIKPLKTVVKVAKGAK